jgi:hypothetical protein
MPSGEEEDSADDPGDGFGGAMDAMKLAGISRVELKNRKDAGCPSHTHTQACWC